MIGRLPEDEPFPERPSSGARYRPHTASAGTIDAYHRPSAITADRLQGNNALTTEWRNEARDSAARRGRSHFGSPIDRWATRSSIGWIILASLIWRHHANRRSRSTPYSGKSPKDPLISHPNSA